MTKIEIRVKGPSLRILAIWDVDQTCKSSVIYSFISHLLMSYFQSGYQVRELHNELDIASNTMITNHIWGQVTQCWQDT